MSPLQDIGFYTLSDERARNASVISSLIRCELILTSRCNFQCPYCRGLAPFLRGDMPHDRASEIIRLWAKDGLQNIRFSGGEPTLYPYLNDVTRLAKGMGVKRIAISTNGSAPKSTYDGLISAGVNDFSISLDACCSADGEKMCGGISGAWDRVIETIRFLSMRVYTTVGIVLTPDNQSGASEIIRLAASLGVSDIRIIPAAQCSDSLPLNLGSEVYDKFPILKYRHGNMASGRPVRGISGNDSPRCSLALDDMAVAGEYHYPCIIYLRENGAFIGKAGKDMRAERAEWVKSHDSYKDKICKANCLDVCVDYNNRVRELQCCPG